MVDAALGIGCYQYGVPHLFVGAADFGFTVFTEYADHPELAQSRRIANAAVEGEISIGETLAMSFIQSGSQYIGEAIGSLIGPEGGIIGGAAGTAVGVGVSIYYVVNAEDIQNETIRKKGEDGKSPVDNFKDIHYSALPGN